jgi:hypothetical protein
MEGLAVKLSKNVRYLVRVRDYETVHIEVGAEISHHDLGFTDDQWAKRSGFTAELEDLMHDQLNAEVDRIAREELTVIAGWSEISPNLAEDYLSVEPPTTMQRKPHATKKTGTDSAPSGGVRRGKATTSTASRPLRPA